eukprot:TRINITY_DN7006_c0_g1_i4.p2 TRINITY_DN7006_c0_g1~~TRINITY_DN7006_c0_g1_i4.p2  ORF type:complete len:172 (+),score=29.69 TRINITY_DN7006_c0_g1_i4:1076-1591(+)
MDVLYKDRVLTGGNDGQAIVWKLNDETQLLYKSACQALDCVHAVNEKHFVTTGEQATMELWSLAKRTPIFTLENTHNSLWICSVAGLRNADLLATGSTDGYVNLYQFTDKQSSIQQIRQIPLEGSINAMQFSQGGNTLVCTQGDEQRLGRWNVVKDTKPGITIFTNLLTKS